MAHPGGRPDKTIDFKIFENLCGLFAKKSEIASVFDLDVRTLEKIVERNYGMSYCEVFDKYSGKGKISLRKAGFELAKRNSAVWIFHAKNYLGLRDEPQEQEDNDLMKSLANAILDRIERSEDENKKNT